MKAMMYCSYCNAEVQQTDKFCPNCGSEVVGNTKRESTTSSPNVTQERGNDRCSMCGHLNEPEVVYCESCGAILPGKTASVWESSKGVLRRSPFGHSDIPSEREKNSSQRKVPQKGKNQKTSAPSTALQFFQSWKFTVGLAVIFIVVLVVIGTSRNQDNHVHNPVSGDFSAHAAQMLAEIEQLQKRVETHPDDMETTLLLANRLHDVKFFPRAITMYQRYLQSNPSSPGARVDLGICYFEMALVDTTVRAEYFMKAQEEMKIALTYDPKHQLAHFNLGIVYLQSGNLQEANNWFKKCIDINPDSETGKRARELYNQHQSTN